MECAYHRFFTRFLQLCWLSVMHMFKIIINNFLFLLAARNITDTDTTTTGGTGDIICVTGGFNGASQMGCCTYLTTVVSVALCVLLSKVLY